MKRKNEKGDINLDKTLKLVIAISLFILAINSFFVVAYLKNIVELMATLINAV